MSESGVIPPPKDRSHAPELLTAARRIRADTAYPAEELDWAVAEWLETEARLCEKRGNSPEGHTFHALKVARAYMAEAVPP